MSEETSSAPETEVLPKPPAPSTDSTESSAPINRRRIGLNVSVQVVLGVILFALVNYLGIRHFAQWDKTYDHEFTLSSDTPTFLKQVDKKLAITVICHKGTPEHKDVWQLVESYHRESKGKLKVDMVDPVKDIEAFDKVSAEASRLRIKVDDLGLFIRVVKTAAEPDPTATGAAAEEALPSASFIPLNSLFIYTKDSNKQPVLSGFNGESLLTGGLMSIAKGDQPKLYVVSNKSKLRFVPTMGNAITEISRMAARQNMKIAPLGLHDVDRIPEDASAVVMVGMDTDLDEREAAMLRDYWHGKHHGLFVMLNRAGDYATPILDQFLTENGVVPQKDRVLRTYGTATGTEKLFENSVTIMDGSPITKSQKGQVTRIPGRSSSLKLTPDAEKPRTENIEIKPLLSPTTGFWGEMNYDDVSPQAGPDDNAPPLYTAASMERGASRDAQISMDSSRMVVLGNCSLMDPDLVLPENQDFVHSCINWLLQRDKYIGINPTPRSTYSIKITPEQKNRIFLLTTIVLPLVVFLLGVVVWGSRRS